MRMGIHIGEAEFNGNNYLGYANLSLVHRWMSAGHGAQILVSSTTESLLQDHLPEHISLREMGTQKSRVYRVIGISNSIVECDFTTSPIKEQSSG